MNYKNLRNKGFTLPEVILIVAALAIVSAMAMPDIAYFFGRQTVEQEKLVLSNIQKALDSYAKECKGLPQLTNNPPRRANDGTQCYEVAPGSGDLTWYQALAGFSNMSAEGIERDVWGNERLYTHGAFDRTYRQGVVTFHYATVRSVGADRRDGTSQQNVAEDWTQNQSDWDSIQEYETVSTQGDDLLVKYTDSQWKVEAQDETVQRIERIIDALDRYAQARFNEEVHAGMSCISEKIFYPPSWAAEPRAHENLNHPQADCRNIGGGSGREIGTGLSYPPGEVPRYGRAVTEDLSRIIGSFYVNTTANNINARREAMEDLMRVLGLPVDHCCSAITDIPFYYYSNPPSVNGDYAISPPYFPPQVRVDPL